MRNYYPELDAVINAQKRFDRLARRVQKKPQRRVCRGLAIVGLVLLGLSLVVPPFLPPVDGVVTSRFFIRFAPDRFGAVELHRGVDFAAPHGSPVRASRSGIVRTVGSSPTLGTYVIITHLLGWETRYAHLGKARISEGAFVFRGAAIGSVGSSGRSTGPHVHFEIGPRGSWLPPGPFLFFAHIRSRLLDFFGRFLGVVTVGGPCSRAGPIGVGGRGDPAWTDGRGRTG